MVISAPILESCLTSNNITNLIFLSPRGHKFDYNIAQEFAKYNELSFLCGRYEGIDQRIFTKYNIIEISIGDFILCGGEVASQVIIESVVRLKTGVLNNENSIIEESFHNGLLEHNHYTRPKIWNNLHTPDYLFNGNHNEINKHRFVESYYNTLNSRQDIFDKYLFHFVIINIFLKISFKKIKKYIL